MGLFAYQFRLPKGVALCQDSYQEPGQVLEKLRAASGRTQSSGTELNKLVDNFDSLQLSSICPPLKLKSVASFSWLWAWMGLGAPLMCPTLSQGVVLLARFSSVVLHINPLHIQYAPPLLYHASYTRLLHCDGMGQTRSPKHAMEAFISAYS